MTAAKNEKIKSATLMQKTRTEVSGTDLLCFHFLMTSLMMNTQAMIDSVPPILGMIARETSRDVKPPLIY